MALGDIIRKRREELKLTQDEVSAMVEISKPYLSNIETGRAKNPPTDGVLRALERRLKFETGELTAVANRVRTPVDVRQEHEQLEAEIEKLRSVIKGLAPAVGKKKVGGVDLDALVKQIQDKSNVKTLTPGRAIPIINKIAAGYPHHFTDLDYPPSVADDYIRCPDIHDRQAFATRVVGDSMMPAYREGDVVVFSPNTAPQAGDDCFVRFSDDGGTTFKRYYQDDDKTIRLQPLNDKYPAMTYPVEQINGLWPAAYRIERLR